MKKYFITIAILLLAAGCAKKQAQAPAKNAPAQNQPSQNQQTQGKLATSAPDSSPKTASYSGKGFFVEYPATARAFIYASNGSELPARQGMDNFGVKITDGGFFLITQPATVKDISPASVSQLFNAVPASELSTMQSPLGGVQAVKVTVAGNSNKTWYYVLTSNGIYEVAVENNTQGQGRTAMQNNLDNILKSLKFEK